MRKFECDGFRRISKAAARKLFETGKVVYLCPVNLRPGGPWHPEMGVKYHSGEGFDVCVNAVTWYNCTGRETGRYLAYYERVGGND